MDYLVLRTLSQPTIPRFHKTILNEFYQIALRKKVYPTLKELQTDLEE